MTRQHTSGEEFFGREAELARLYALSRQKGIEIIHQNLSTEEVFSSERRATNALLLGPPRVGKTALLHRTFERLFNEAGESVPFFFAFRRSYLEPARFARAYLTHFLSQFIAFRHRDKNYFNLVNEPLTTIAQKAHPEEYHWLSELVSAFRKAEQANDPQIALKLALAAPLTAASNSNLMPFIMLDNFHQLSDADADLRFEIIRALVMDEHSFVAKTNSTGQPTYVLCGLRRLLVDILPADEGIFDKLDIIQLETIEPGQLELMIRAVTSRRAIEISDSTIELMIQQLNGDLFYTHSLLDAAVANRSSLKKIIDFERLYTEEILQGRIRLYLDTLLRDVAPLLPERRAVLELLSIVINSAKPLPLEVAIARMKDYTEEADRLLRRLHSREFINLNYNFVSAANDPVLADFVKDIYRHEISGIARPVIGEELLGEKLKHSYGVMMSRYHRSIEYQLLDLLSRFDFQTVPLSLFDEDVYENRYRAVSRAQIRNMLDEEVERIRLPELVLVNDIASAEHREVNFRLFTGGGFDGGIYSAANEVLWFVALINSREPLDVDAIRQIEQRFHLDSRDVIGNAANLVRWYISKEGFSKDAAAELKRLKAHRSSYVQLDLLFDYVRKLAVREAEATPASVIELVIPIDEEAELIAVRTVEQIARSADFDKESINQIKTALIEACINAAEHGESPDRKIYHRFALEEDRLVISISNKGKAFRDTADNGEEATTRKGKRGRGLKIIRGLMDEVKFEPADEGTTLVMTKLLKRTDKQ